jgi:hypothetical protein
MQKQLDKPPLSRLLSLQKQPVKLIPAVTAARCNPKNMTSNQFLEKKWFPCYETEKSWVTYLQDIESHLPRAFLGGILHED